MRPIEVPEMARQRATAHGDAGRRWLDDLAGVVAELAIRWGLELGGAMTGGTASYVVAAADPAGRACVLKVAMRLDQDDLDAFDRSVFAHQVAGGRGCAELYAHDDEMGALLLERLGPDLHAAGRSVDEVLLTIADTLRDYWRPIPYNRRLRTGPDQAAWLAAFIQRTWDDLGRPCERAVVERAVALCERRAAAFDPSAAVLVHGDAHGWNTLEAGDGRAKFVDPEGLWSERAHDLAVAMREYNQPLLAGDTARLVRDRADLIAVRCDVDPQAVWEWGYIERVSTGLASLRDFVDGDGSAFLEVAARSR